MLIIRNIEKFFRLNYKSIDAKILVQKIIWKKYLKVSL